MPLSDKRCGCGLRALATVAPGDTYQTVLAACRSRLLFPLPNSPPQFYQRCVQRATRASCSACTLLCPLFFFALTLLCLLFFFFALTLLCLYFFFALTLLCTYPIPFFRTYPAVPLSRFSLYPLFFLYAYSAVPLFFFALTLLYPYFFALTLLCCPRMGANSHFLASAHYDLEFIDTFSIPIEAQAHTIPRYEGMHRCQESLS